jgi:N-methylhydantoinase A
LGIRSVIVPPAAGVGSALGLLEARESLELARTAITRLDDHAAHARAADIFAALESEANEVVGHAWDASGLTVQRTVGMRFVGQGYELEVPVHEATADIEALVESFRRQYQRTYGYREELPVEAVTWYLTLVRQDADGHRPSAQRRAGRGEAKGERRAYFPETGTVTVTVYERIALGGGQRLDGPCLIEDPHTTVVVLPGDQVDVEDDGTIVIRTPQQVDA